MSRVKTEKGRSKVKVGEAASRVGEQVYHTGQGQDERAEASRPVPAPTGLSTALTRRGLLAATHTGSRERGVGLRQTLEQARPRGHVRQRGDAGTASLSLTLLF